MRHFAKNMVDTMPVENRLKFNNVIKKSMMKQVALNSSKSNGNDSDSSNNENSYLESIYSPMKNSAPGATGNFNNSSELSEKSESFANDSKNGS